MVSYRGYRTCDPQLGFKRWECNRPHAPIKFSEKFQRYSAFSLGYEFHVGQEYYYISTPTHHHGRSCLRLRVYVCCSTGEAHTHTHTHAHTYTYTHIHIHTYTHIHTHTHTYTHTHTDTHTHTCTILSSGSCSSVCVLCPSRPNLNQCTGLPFPRIFPSQ
uniref:Ephrin RBD domain-containing protein n=1 Tax=Oncorhynchus kisutch TaxID=8019 RepID=A0A8C7LBM8_ONCKI